MNRPGSVKTLAIVLVVLTVLATAVYAFVDRAQITPEEGLEASNDRNSPTISLRAFS